MSTKVTNLHIPTLPGIMKSYVITGLLVMLLGGGLSFAVLTASRL